MAESLKDDGYLEICSPAECPFTIPSFSMGWIISVADFALYSGRIEAVRKLYNYVKKMLDSYISSIDEGLLLTPSGKGVITSYSIHYTKLYDSSMLLIYESSIFFT